MRRILAEVLESNLSKPDGSQSGVPWREATCLVKLLSSVPESHHLPDDVKDSTCTVRRRALFDYEYKPGTKIVLSPDECAPLVRRPAEIPKTGSLRGRVATYRTDINSDGFAERVVENSFLRVVIGPRFGARIWEIHHKRAGWNPLSASYDFSKDWYEMGGQQDQIFWPADQGELWNAKFAEKEIVTDDSGFRGVYEFISEKSKGVTFIKEIKVPVDAPLVHYQCTVKYAGAEKPPEDGKPDELEMAYWPRIGVAVPEAKKGSFVFVVPTKARLHRLRRSRGWHTPRCFGMSAPYMLAQDEDTGRCLALLLDPAQTHFGIVCEGRSEFVTIEPKTRQVKVPKDGEQSYGYALVVGDAADAGADGLSISTTGPRDSQQTPVFAMNTSESATTAKLPARRSRVSVEMHEIEYAGLPKIVHGTTWLSRNGGKRK